MGIDTPGDVLDALLMSDEYEGLDCFYFGDTNDIYPQSAYIYYTPSFPWGMSEQEKNLTREDVNDLLVKIISTLSDTWSEDEIRQRITNISTAGRG